jgi:hypothetical protein
MKLEEVKTVRSFRLEMTEVEAGELLGVLNGVYTLPVAFNTLESRLLDLNVSQIGYLGRDEDGDPAWEAGEE